MPLKLKRWLWLSGGFLLIFLVVKLYPIMLFEVMGWQRSFNQALSGSLHQLSQHSYQAGLTLIAVSFIYGVFHSVGPGHGKFILSSYLSFEQTKLRQAMSISLCAALVQGIVAIVLVTIVVVILSLSRRYFHFTLQWIERGSFLLMIGFGLWWCYSSWQAVRKNKKNHSPKIRQIRPLDRHILALQTHSHTSECHCGHQHLPEATQLQKLTDWKSQMLLVLSMGSRPCSGAILVLFLSYTLDLYPWGIFAVLVMSFGTGITLSLLAFLVLFARRRAIQLSGWYLSTSQRKRFVLGLKLLTGIVLIGFGILLLQSSFIDTRNGMLFQH